MQTDLKIENCPISNTVWIIFGSSYVKIASIGFQIPFSKSNQNFLYIIFYYIIFQT